MTLNIEFARMTIDRWAGEIANMPTSGMVDYRAFIPIEWFTDSAVQTDKVGSTVTSLFTRERRRVDGTRFAPVHDWKATYRRAQTLVNRTADRKVVDGLIDELGWRFNGRLVPDGSGYEVRPGVAFVIAHRGAMPTCRILARIAAQGQGNEVDRINVYDPILKGMGVGRFK